MMCYRLPTDEPRTSDGVPASAEACFNRKRRSARNEFWPNRTSGEGEVVKSTFLSGVNR